MADREWVDVAKMNNMQNIKKWINKFIEGSSEFDSIHIDEIDIDFDRRLNGQSLLFYLNNFMQSIVSGLKEIPDSCGLKYAVIYVPLESGGELLIWRPECLLQLGSVFESPCLYLIRSNEIFDDSSEEYRRPLSILSLRGGGFRTIFRSFRNQEAIDNDWEFTNGIYIIYDFDVDGRISVNA